MKCPPALPTEPERLKALAAYGLGSDRPLPSLDPVVQIAARMFGMPVAAVNMIGSDHVFFAASTGIDPARTDMSRNSSFCAHAITQQDVMVVPDATQDERFHDNPLVTGPANLRFYAGVPLTSPEGHALGALCVIDGRPRHDFSDEDRVRLRELAKMASDRLELRRVEISTEQARLPFEEFARNSPTAVVWFDKNRRIVAWNAAAAHLQDYALSEGAGRSLETLVPERYRAEMQALIGQAVAAGSVDGLAMPAAFLSALEGGPLASVVGSWVIDEACAQVTLWRRCGAEHFRIGVNLCSAQFRTGDLVARIVATLDRHGLPPDALELEVTENLVLENDDVVFDALQRLHDHGVGIAFDDFGSGYGSLSLLKSYPLSRIKIDRSFVQGVLHSERDASVIRAILGMAKSFQLETIAEGVEDENQMRCLHRYGCEEGQGYLFGKPVSAMEFGEMFGLGLTRRMAAR